ncbi:hypothetical protein C0995_007078, partial [Termitomyces sp. Mi166
MSTSKLWIVDPHHFTLGICVNRDRSLRKLWISQKGFITDLLASYNLTEAKASKVPLHHPLHNLPDPPPNSLPEIANDDIK